MAAIHYINHIARKTLQGGIPNELYPRHLLEDWRLLHHIATIYMLNKMNYGMNCGDSKFHDAVNTDGKKAEGKKLSKKGGVDFKPSVDTGAGRKFNQENLDKCFEINDFYFIYEIAGIDEEYLHMHTYWIPIAKVREWYAANGKSGKICYTKFKKCLDQVEFERIEETRD